jgi:hypothetical protein
MLDFSTVHGWLRAAHIIPGFLGLAAFWVPMFAKKGGRIHIFFGWIFVACAATVIVSALTSCAWGLIDPRSFAATESLSAGGVARIRFFTAFLGALAVYTAIPLWLAIRVIRLRKQLERLGESLTWPLIVVQAITALALIASAAWWVHQFGWQFQAGVLAGIGGLGLYATANVARFVARPPQEKMTWWYKHMEYMMTCGIAFHTAFLVFGLNRFIGDYLNGPWAFLPWVLPTLIGVPATSIWVRYYRRKFRDE